MLTLADLIHEKKMMTEYTQVGCSPQEAWDMFHALEDISTWPDEAGLNKLVADGQFESYAEATDYFYFQAREAAARWIDGVVRPARPPVFPDTEEPF